jgi:hypothetical protein
MVVETLLKSDKPTITLEALKDGKIRANSSVWADAHVILADQALEAKWEAAQVTLIRRRSRRNSVPLTRPMISRIFCDGVTGV